jgi:translation initiation factor IF-2
LPQKKIRVYELARELGLTNKEALDLAELLKIGVKSHSSSIEDAQADRVRRKADELGMRRETSPEEPAPPKKAAAKATKATPPTADEAAAPTASPVAPTPAPPGAPAAAPAAPATPAPDRPKIGRAHV